MTERDIFIAALQQDDPAQRQAYLNEACARQPELRKQVEDLLRLYQGAGSFLQKPAVESSPNGAFHNSPEPISSPEGPGTIIGPYKLLEQIGEGGFGIVFLAEQQQPVRRKVALKVLKPGMDTRQIIARFEAERQALALMDHPNIARVFDGGETVLGRPYFVMELVRGVPITDFCDANHLPIQDRLDLFITVCHAVQHAHQKGVIHRDLKPSNIMVTLHDGTPVVKVIDFGIAKALGQQLTDKTLFTHFVQMIGTPVYMSPEQAEMSGLDMDTRSDIYSLGVLLYELLTGTTPCDKVRLQTAAFDEIRRMIREDEPATPSRRITTLGEAATVVSANRKTDPSRLSRAVHGDLDWIVMKALEKDRRRRYETASALAADVLRHLQDEPILARPPSTMDRWRRTFRRHKVVVVACAAVLLALVIGIFATTYGMIQANEAQAIAVKEARAKENALKDRESALHSAQQSEREKSAQLWQALVAQARANRLSHRPGQRFETLAILQHAIALARTLDLPPMDFYELRNAVIATLALPDLYLGKPWNAFPADGYAVDFDVAQAVYARTDRQGNCSVRRVADDVEIHSLPGLGQPAFPVLSRDARFVAIIYLDTNNHVGVGVHVWQLDSGSALPSPATASSVANTGPSSGTRRILAEAQARRADFARDNGQIVLAYNDGAIRLFELPSGRRLKLLPPDPVMKQDIKIALNPVEPVVAVCSYYAPTVQLRDLETGKVIASLPQPVRPNSIAWHPDGQTLAVGYGESNIIRLYESVAGASLYSGFHLQTEGNPLPLPMEYHRPLPQRQGYRTLEGAQWGAEVAFNHAGDRLAISGWKGAHQLFDVGTGQKLFEVPQSTVSVCRFSQDDRYLGGDTQEGKLGSLQVADGREYRTLIHMGLTEKVEYSAVAVNPDNKLLAVSTPSGFVLWDLFTGSELAFISTEIGDNRVLFEASPSGALLTLCPTGLWRWPVKKDTGASQWTFGPPERLPLPPGQGIDQSSDGRVIVTCTRATGPAQAAAGAYILHADRPDRPIRLDAGADIGGVAVSPDGRWVVTVSHQVGLAKVWDARAGRLIKQLTGWGAGFARFSPDGRWLAIRGGATGGQSVSSIGAASANSQEPNLSGTGSKLPVAPDATRASGMLLATGTWEPGPHILAHTFTPDGQIAANATTTGIIHLVDVATGRELARLEDPNLDSTDDPVFTPDGTKLISHDHFKGVNVWNLRLIRQQLANLGLDWESQQNPPSPLSPGGRGTWGEGGYQPLKLQVRGADLIRSSTPNLTPEEKARLAIDQAQQALAANPDDALACNNLAWYYLTAPEKLRDNKAALSLAEKANRLAPGNANYQNTLGVAYYRAGKYREAVDVLRANLDRQGNTSLAHDLYFLALSNFRLGQSDKARDYYDWALRWTRMQTNLSTREVEELALFRAEAEELMGK